MGHTYQMFMFSNCGTATKWPCATHAQEQKTKQNKTKKKKRPHFHLIQQELPIRPLFIQHLQFLPSKNNNKRLDLVYAVILEIKEKRTNHLKNV